MTEIKTNQWVTLLSLCDRFSWTFFLLLRIKSAPESQRNLWFLDNTSLLKESVTSFPLFYIRWKVKVMFVLCTMMYSWEGREVRRRHVYGNDPLVIWALSWEASSNHRFTGTKRDPWHDMNDMFRPRELWSSSPGRLSSHATLPSLHLFSLRSSSFYLFYTNQTTSARSRFLLVSECCFVGSQTAAETQMAQRNTIFRS